jgi:hypothetical protein
MLTNNCCLKLTTFRNQCWQTYGAVWIFNALVSSYSQRCNNNDAANASSSVLQHCWLHQIYSMDLQERLQELRHFQALLVPCAETLMREVKQLQNYWIWQRSHKSGIGFPWLKVVLYFFVAWRNVPDSGTNDNADKGARLSARPFYIVAPLVITNFRI